ncbi:hypothetical protein OG883_10805 [Streptomyces sp. NBC_01142]|uniref:hypothetical protein n=1 Tax=Streptomyces sp. NBC_01142 TaxID=2975865 RepID=UPI0022550EA8|nr:hypothetical protein [Streptomyces sp. NBC_01142]MCX4820390.1 hypothetical protein [Streptomyces sp. NBC_01142]
MYVVPALLAGVRTEEGRALTWEHVHEAEPDEARPHVDVWPSVRLQGDTKTSKSRRLLVMPHQAASVLETHKARQQQEAGANWEEDAFVFPSETGERRSSVRMLRTSFVSLLSDHGIPIEVIAPSWATAAAAPPSVSVASNCVR